MQGYMVGVIFLNFLVDFFLLLGTDRLCGYPSRLGRTALAAVLGGIYSGACMRPGFAFLGNILWRTIGLILMAAVAFGFHKSAVRRGVVFVLLCMALGGVVSGVGNRNAWFLLVAAGGLYGLCAVGMFGQFGTRRYVPVELIYGDKRVQLTALRDTGNTLLDPITGRPVLVIAPEAACQLTGLSREQLRAPVESLGTIPGLRLIPFCTVGCGNGLLLALKFPEVRIGNWRGSTLVAFAPEGLSTEGTYQALTGGVV